MGKELEKDTKINVEIYILLLYKVGRDVITTGRKMFRKRQKGYFEKVTKGMFAC